MHADPESTARAAVDAAPRVRLAHLPTPLDQLHQLGARLGPQVHLKRDDLTGLALGGDKPRKLEYELALAKTDGADIVVTCGSAQSNHARLTTAAARVLGMDAAVVLGRDTHACLQGNLLIVHLLGADVRLVDVGDHSDLEGPALQLCEELRAEGRRPHYVPISGTTAVSCLGYVRAGFELVDQLRERDLLLDAVYVPFGTGGIFTSTLLALRLAGSRVPVIGISVNHDRSACHESMRHWQRAVEAQIGLDHAGDLGPYEIDDGFVGDEYGHAAPECLDAILEFGRTEGVLLDPVYSGKMAAGFLAHIRSGRWSSAHRIALLHSGGVPALFAYREEIARHLRTHGERVVAAHPRGADPDQG